MHYVTNGTDRRITEMSKVQIYTDGSARGNPDGPGGYGAVLHFTDSKGQLHEKELSAGYKKPPITGWS